jgi:hypothetical protein
MDTATRREIDRLWKEGIQAVRYDIRDLKDDVKGIESSIDVSRRWVIGLILSLMPVYATAIIALIRM